MSKRTLYYIDNFQCDPLQQNHVDRQKGEQMCQNKLKKISNVKSNLCQTVLVRNTLKYVQNSAYVTFDCDDDSELADDEPLHKIKRDDTFSDDIDDILNEMIFLQPLLLPPDDF